MAVICNRAFTRNEHKARITYSDYNHRENHFHAVMLNSSEGGMYFESEERLEPGMDLWIQIEDLSSDIHGMQAYNGYRAEVMWCRKIYKEGGSTCYGTGVRFMVNICGQCGQKVAYSDIHKLENFLFLCSNCVKQLESLPDGLIKESFHNYLLGNVI